jgi:phosphoheptose isomerase
MLVSPRPNYNRESIPAFALAQYTSIITACGNDYGYDNLYSRLLSSLGKKEDILIVISASGESQNILLAKTRAKETRIQFEGFFSLVTGFSYICITQFFTLVKIQKEYKRHTLQQGTHGVY